MYPKTSDVTDPQANHRLGELTGPIPDYQNGFREGYRTNNNPFILRCVKEWARANGLTLYVEQIK
jgi:hypothetical protein